MNNLKVFEKYYHEFILEAKDQICVYLPKLKKELEYFLISPIANIIDKYLISELYSGLNKFVIAEFFKFIIIGMDRNSFLRNDHLIAEKSGLIIKNYINPTYGHDNSCISKCSVEVNNNLNIDIYLQNWVLSEIVIKFPQTKIVYTFPHDIVESQLFNVMGRIPELYNIFKKYLYTDLFKILRKNL